MKEIQAYTALFIDYQMIMEELCEMQVSYDQVIGYDTQISKLQEEYNRYYSLKASLDDDLKEGLISKEEFDDFRESYGRKCEELEQMIENQKKLVKQMFEGGVSATVQLEDWKKSLEIKELDRTLLALTVDKIYIYENKQIKIHIRYQDMIEKMKVKDGFMRNTGQSAGKRWNKWQGQQKDIRKTQRRKFLGFRYVWLQFMPDYP